MDVSVQDCLAFSSSCYHASNIGIPAVSTKWKSLKSSQEIGVSDSCTVDLSIYRGICYYQILPEGGIKVAIAHSGKVSDNEKENIFADIINAKFLHPKLLATAWWYVSQVITQISSTLGAAHYKITHTGFSFGGFIAHACAARDPFATSVAFDCPGVRNLIANEELCYKLKHRLVTYVTSPNLVNCSLEHVGEIRRFISFQKYDSNSSKTSLDLVINFSDIGLGLHSDKEIELPIEKEQENAVLVECELANTLTSHNFAALMSLPSLDFEVVEYWPSASIEVLYDTQPAQFSNVNPIFCDDVFSNLFGALICWFGDVTQLDHKPEDAHMRTNLWQRTSRQERNSEVVTGAVAVRYSRKPAIPRQRLSPEADSAVPVKTGSSLETDPSSSNIESPANDSIGDNSKRSSNGQSTGLTNVDEIPSQRSSVTSEAQLEVEEAKLINE